MACLTATMHSRQCGRQLKYRCKVLTNMLGLCLATMRALELTADHMQMQNAHWQAGPVLSHTACCQGVLCRRCGQQTTCRCKMLTGMLGLYLATRRAVEPPRVSTTISAALTCVTGKLTCGAVVRAALGPEQLGIGRRSKVLLGSQLHVDHVSCQNRAGLMPFTIMRVNLHICVCLPLHPPSCPPGP